VLTFSKNYLLASIGLAAVFVMGVIPADISPDEGKKFYGVAELTMYDAQDNVLFTQTVHNRLVDTGEDFLIDSAFNEGTTQANATAIGAICISNDSTAEVEGLTAVTFDSNNSLETGGENNCEQSANSSTTGGIVTLGPMNFEAVTGDDNLIAATVNMIGVCQASGNGVDFNNCQTTGILFANVITSAVALVSGESVDVTYTFDMSSSGT